MQEKFSGKILFENGVPAENVQVRVFDKDEDSKDDNLTIQPGLSDSQGQFTLTYEPSRYLDYKTITTKLPQSLFKWKLSSRSHHIPDLKDIYLPYLEFRYSHKARIKHHTAAMIPFVREFRLPEIFTPDVTFLPSQHGFNFLNRFPGYPLPFSIPKLPNITDIESTYGLCGGMSAATCDFFLAQKTMPEIKEPPAKGTPLYKYLYRRQTDSFGAFGTHIAKFAQWMVLPEDTVFGTQKRTYDQFEEISNDLDDGNLAVIGLVYVGGSTVQIWENHQVLAYKYEEFGNDIKLYIYDPNYPNQDDVFIAAQRIPVGKTRVPGDSSRRRTVMGLRCKQKRSSSQKEKAVRGFFKMPYQPVEIPVDL